MFVESSRPPSPTSMTATSTLRAREVVEGHRRRRLEEGRADLLDDRRVPRDELDDVVGGNRLAGDDHALAKVDEVRRRVRRHAKPLAPRAAPTSSRRCFPSRSCRRRGAPDTRGADCRVARGARACARGRTCSRRSFARRDSRARPDSRRAERFHHVVPRGVVSRRPPRRRRPAGHVAQAADSPFASDSGGARPSRACRGRAGTPPSGTLRGDPGRASA